MIYNVARLIGRFCIHARARAQTLCVYCYQDMVRWSKGHKINQQKKRELEKRERERAIKMTRRIPLRPKWNFFCLLFFFVWNYKNKVILLLCFCRAQLSRLVGKGVFLFTRKGSNIQPSKINRVVKRNYAESKYLVKKKKTTQEIPQIIRPLTREGTRCAPGKCRQQFVYRERERNRRKAANQNGDCVTWPLWISNKNEILLHSPSSTY